MTFKYKLLLAHLLIGCYVISIYSTQQHVLAKVATDTVNVAPPTEEKETDRASIQTAFDSVRPGGTILFSPGTYFLGAGARLTVPDVTVLGHPEGTVLRGCDPEAFKPEATEMMQIVFGCTGLYVQAERQTLRGLTFEYMWDGIVVGPYPTTVEEAAAAGERMELLSLYPAGGQRIESNTFRTTVNGLRVLGTGNELSVVRDNDFIDVFHAIGIYGAPFHFLDNRVKVADPGGVPFTGHPGSAVIVAPGHTDCTGHVVARNLIEGYPDPIYVQVNRGETCRNVEIRDNTILRATRVEVPEAGGFYKPTEEDSTMVGTPITLMNNTEPMPGMPESGTEGILEDILVQKNQIFGAEGLGILVQNASRSQIAENRITGVKRRTPFPGITWDGLEQRWQEGNGSGIWLSSGSDNNKIVGNSFEDIASFALLIEGDSNQVVMRSLEDEVRDLGSGNQIHLEKGKDTIRSTDQCIEKTLLTHIEELKIPGASLVVMKNGRIILEETYGQASLELDVDVTPLTLFPYASISKIFTGTAVLRLVQNGVFSLDDSITELIPNLPRKWSQVTVRHLLSNTSGLPDLNEDWRFENPFIAPKKSWIEILENLTNRQVDFAPGEGYAYNNTNYALLGMLIEQTDGRKIEEYVREEFAFVYGIESLRYGDARDVIPGRATWYTHFDFNSETPQLGSIRPLWIEYPPFFFTAAGLNGTARDLARFIGNIVSGQILEDEYKREMWSASKLADGTTFHFDDSKTGTGLGWLVHDDPENPYVEMSGGSSGTVRHYIKDSLTVVLLTNLMGSQPEKIVNNLAENCLKPGTGN